MSKHLYLCSTIGEIRHRLAFPRNPLEIFQVVNLYQPQNWRFSFHFDTTGKVSLNIEFGLQDDPFFIISSGVLGAFDCDWIEVKHLGDVWTCNWQRGLSYQLDHNVLEYVTNATTDIQRPGVRLAGFSESAFPQEFSRWEVVEKYLHKNTWLGSSALRRDLFSIEIAVFDNRRTFRNCSCSLDRLRQQKAEGIPTLYISGSLGSPALGEVHLMSSATDADQSFRWTQSGCVSRQDLLEKLDLKLYAWQFKGELEVDFPNRKLGPDGTLAMDDACILILAALQTHAASLEYDVRFLEYIKACGEFEKKISARRIDKRKENLLHAKFVYFNNQLVYKVPTNEMETISLHQKLEGMGGLPFAAFASLEYTPKLGIDAIVNFMIRETESIHRFATVEFEYKFENFFAHAHPVEQTDMIICWEGAISSPLARWNYEPDIHLPWLGYLRVSDKTIKVTQVARYPGIEIGGLQGINHE